MECLINQEYKNFEVLIFHDGHNLRHLPSIWRKIPYATFSSTATRANDFGHTNRDTGIRRAQGEYIVHFNPDNILYPNALKELAELSEDKDYPFRSNDILIMPILMRGHYRYGSKNLYAARFKNLTSRGMIFNGDPAIRTNIDCMQLVMKRDLWRKYGGWYDKSEQSDGIMYERFVQENGARYCHLVLGEHR